MVEEDSRDLIREGEGFAGGEGIKAEPVMQREQQ